MNDTGEGERRPVRCGGLKGEESHEKSGGRGAGRAGINIIQTVFLESER